MTDMYETVSCPMKHLAMRLSAKLVYGMDVCVPLPPYCRPTASRDDPERSWELLDLWSRIAFSGIQSAASKFPNELRTVYWSSDKDEGKFSFLRLHAYLLMCKTPVELPDCLSYISSLDVMFGFHQHSLGLFFFQVFLAFARFHATSFFCNKVVYSAPDLHDCY